MTLEHERKGTHVFGVRNPDCKKPFGYQEGRFFRFRKAYLAGGQRPNTHCVRHLRLYGNFSEKYTLAYEGTGCCDHMAALGPCGGTRCPSICCCRLICGDAIHDVKTLKEQKFWKGAG
jgi:hypothetical protein